jgi:hypothetical protein
VTGLLHISTSSSVPTALAGLLLYIRDRTNKRPHVYFEWTEGTGAELPAIPRLGQGEVALVTREIIRQYEPDHSRRRTFTPTEERRRAP